MNFILSSVQKIPPKEMEECYILECEWQHSVPKDLVSEKFLSLILPCCGSMPRSVIWNPTARFRETPEGNKLHKYELICFSNGAKRRGMTFLLIGYTVCLATD
jgi:hypothetical protein